MGAKINVSLHYPYSEEYNYESYLEHINLDREKVKDVTSGNGFIVSSPKAIKDDIKDEYGIFSSKFGQTLQDVNPYGNRYRCKCGAMFNEVVSHFTEEMKESEEDERPKIAIIGKPNVGKSSIINKLLGEDRVIVSDIAGTTRDAIDTVVTRNDREYVFIDTAGLRRKNKIKEEIERFSIIRTVTAVERADV